MLERLVALRQPGQVTLHRVADRDQAWPPAHLFVAFVPALSRRRRHVPQRHHRAPVGC
jgi:hypothetical protein